MNHAEAEDAGPWSGIAAVALVVIAAALRVAAGYTDFWMDEVWTLYYAERIESAKDVFTEIRHSNNHHLLTLYYYWVQQVVEPTAHWIVYRIPSLAAGVLTVVVAAWMARRRGSLAALVTLVMLGGSYLMTHFASEARGYALVILLSFLSLAWSRAYLERSRTTALVGFWIVGSVGFLCHLMYLNTLLSLAGSVFFEGLRHRESRGKLWKSGLWLFSVPGVFLLWFHWFEIQHLRIGEGPERSFLLVVVESLSMTGGGPARGMIAWIAGSAVAAMFLTSLVSLARRGDREWPFLALIMFVTPTTLILVTQPKLLFLRYFLLAIAFGLYATSLCVARWLDGTAPWRNLAMAVLAAFLLTNALRISHLLEEGRGAFGEAVRYMAANTPGKLTTVLSIDEFGNRMLLEYHGRFLEDGEQIALSPRKELPAQGAAWFLRHKIGEPPEPLAEWKDRHGNRYDLAQSYGYAGLSGAHWSLYRNRRLP